MRLLVEAAKLHTEANLRVVELAEAAAGELVRAEGEVAAEEEGEATARLA